MTKTTTHKPSERLSKAAGINLRTAETFIRAFAETVVECARKDGAAKVSQLGIFKIQTVADRESVKITTGERFVIPGYNKLTFTPEAVLTDILTDQPPLLPIQSATAEPKTTTAAAVPAPTTAPRAEEERIPDTTRQTTPTQPKTRISLWTALPIAVLAVIVAVAVISSNKDKTPAGNPRQPAAQPTLTLDDDTQDTDSKPRIHILQKGESLTTISVHYYGTPDSMAAIWRLNKFPNPNDIPLGTEILLP